MTGAGAGAKNMDKAGAGITLQLYTKLKNV